MAVGNYMEARINYSAFGQRLMNVLNYRIATQGGAVTDRQATEALAEAIGSGDFMTELLACVPNNISVVWVDAQIIYPARIRSRRFTVNLSGTWEHDTPTQNVQASVSKFTALAGRDQQGAMHIPIDSSAFGCLDGLLTTELFDALDAFKDNLIDLQVGAFSAGTFQPILLHKVPGPLAWQHDDITDATVQNTVRVMSRRTVGRGI